MHNEEMICAIANGSVSASRTRRLIKAIYGVDIEIKEIIEVCAKQAIPLPKKHVPQFSVEVLYEVRDYNIVWYHERPAVEGGYTSSPETIDTIKASTACEALSLWAQKNPEDPILRALRQPYIKKTHCRLEAFPVKGSSPKNIDPGVGLITDKAEAPILLGYKVWKLDGDRKVEVTPAEYAIALSEIDLPDSWSLLLSYKSDWVRMRRYWGDEAADRLKSEIENADELKFEWLHSQISRYIDPHIRDRVDIQFDIPLGWKARSKEDVLKEFQASGYLHQDIGKELGALLRFPGELKAKLYVEAYTRELQENPRPQVGVKYPLPSLDWHEFKRKKYCEDCLAIAPTEEDLVQFFVEFWQEIHKNRGEDFLGKLKSGLVGGSEYSRPFYSSTQNNFEHFLANLNGFKSIASWRIPLYAGSAKPLPMRLYGAILKYGWKKVRDLVTFSLTIKPEEL